MFLQRDQTQVSLTQVGVWFIGEYGEELLDGHYDQQRQQQLEAVSEEAILDLLQSILNNSSIDGTTKSEFQFFLGYLIFHLTFHLTSSHSFHSHDAHGTGQVIGPI